MSPKRGRPKRFRSHAHPRGSHDAVHGHLQVIRGDPRLHDLPLISLREKSDRAINGHERTFGAVADPKLLGWQHEAAFWPVPLVGGDLDFEAFFDRSMIKKGARAYMDLVFCLSLIHI